MPLLPKAEFERMRLPHSDPNAVAQDSVEFLRSADLPRGACIVGISLGGLIAAKLQESGREDLRVICISSPTWADEVVLERKMPHRYAIYSSNDEVIRGRTDQWPELAAAQDMPWLTHDTDAHKRELAKMVAKIAHG